METLNTGGGSAISDAAVSALSDTRQVPDPCVIVVYAGKDISAEIAPHLTDFSYTDVLEGESDSVEISVMDADGKWQGPWYPQHGDALDVSIGYAEGPLLRCGRFEVDECELDGPPDVIRIKGLSAGVQRSVRTHKAQAYEDTTLLKIAQDVAARNQLTLSGTVEAIAIRRVTQAFDTDLRFLKRVADEYGYAFTVRGAQLCFFQRSALKSAKPVLRITRGDVSRFTLKDKIRGVVGSTEVHYHDPKTKASKKHSSADPKAQGNRHSKDTQKLNVRAENADQAKRKADAAQDKTNEEQSSARLSLPGNVRLVAGINVVLDGFGHYDGIYTIHRSTHRVSRASGYATEIEAKRVRDEPPKPKAAK